MWYTGWQSSSYGNIYVATSPDGYIRTKYDNSIPTALDTIGTNGRVPRGATE